MFCCLLRVLNVSLNLSCVLETPVLGLGLAKAPVIALPSESFWNSIDYLSYAWMKSLKFLNDFLSGSPTVGTCTSS